MQKVLLLGAGKIGQMIARFLLDTGDYQVRIANVDPESLRRLGEKLDAETVVVDAQDPEVLAQRCAVRIP